VQQATARRDLKKPSPIISYLPQYDPGSTYSGLMTGPIVGSLEENPEVEGPRRKRARMDKGCVPIRLYTPNLNVALAIQRLPYGEPLSVPLKPTCVSTSHFPSQYHYTCRLIAARSQRTSTRNLASVIPLDTAIGNEQELGTALEVADTDLMEHESDGAVFSRSNSRSNFEDSGNSISRMRREKGLRKGKEREKLMAKIKEEPQAVTLQLSESSSSLVRLDSLYKP